jgi:hypothetical protein
MFSLLALSLNSEHFVSALKLDWTIWMDGMAWHKTILWDEVTAIMVMMIMGTNDCIMRER